MRKPSSWRLSKGHTIRKCWSWKIKLHCQFLEGVSPRTFHLLQPTWGLVSLAWNFQKWAYVFPLKWHIMKMSRPPGRGRTQSPSKSPKSMFCPMQFPRVHLLGLLASSLPHFQLLMILSCSLGVTCLCQWLPLIPALWLWERCQSPSLFCPTYEPGCVRFQNKVPKTGWGA